MDQVYTKYTTWECWKNGMWSKVDSKTEKSMLKTAIEFTGNHVIYGEQMRVVAYEWNNTMLNHLTNKSINRLAFLGHCAVSVHLKIPEYIVRKAWKELTEDQRDKANNEAKNTIKEWELWYIKKLKNTLKNGKNGVMMMESQTKLPWS